MRRPFSGGYKRRAMETARQLRATLIGFTAVLLWALLALFTTWSSRVPPFQRLALTFGIAFLLGLAWLLATRGPAGLRLLRQPPGPWLLGVGGLFGYHLFYFLALDHAPPVEASLIAYLWPLLIVLFSALLPGERLRGHHVAGALLGLLGAALLVTRGGSLAFEARFLGGYLAALACALTWSGYSVASRRFRGVPSEAVTGFCGAVALLGLFSHLLFESWSPPGVGGWLAVLALGLGPVGAAFFLWDYGVKRGNIQVLGASSYAAPLLSTLLLLAFGRAEPRWEIAAACLLIVGGALTASFPLLLGRRRSLSPETSPAAPARTPRN